MTHIYDPDWIEEHEHYWDDGLQRSFDEEEEDETNPQESEGP